MEKLIEKLDAANPDEYMKDLLTQHLEALEKAIAATTEGEDRQHLFYLFVCQLNKERRWAIRLEVCKAHDAEKRLNLKDTFMREWRALSYRDRMNWVRFVEAWGEPLYKDRTLGELAIIFMGSLNIREFAENAGLTRDVAYGNVAPRLKALSIERWEYWLPS